MVEVRSTELGARTRLARRLVRSSSFRSLSHRNFRIFFVTQTVSFLGTWMQLVAQTLLIYRLTGSGTAVGILTVCQFLPTLLLVAWAGAVVDRSDTRRLMTLSSAVMMLSALVMGTLSVTGRVTPAAVYILATVLGVANTFDGPGRRTLVNELVPGEHVSNAVSLSSTIAMGTRIVGPAFAGLLIATVGIGWCFLLNGVSFVVAIAGLWMMDTATLHARPPVPRAPGQVRAGLRYAWRTPPLRQALLLLLALGAVSMNFHVTLALYVKIGLGGSDGLYAALSAVSGIGALAGGLMLARRTMIDVAFLGWMTLVYAVALGLLACSPDAWWALIPLALVGLGQLGVLASASTVVQVQSLPSMRGRVLALFTLATVGANPVGGAVAGWSADRFGASFTVAYGALFTFVLGLGTVWVARRKPRGAWHDENVLFS